MNELIGAKDGVHLALVAKPTILDIIKFGGRFHVECFKPDGTLRWEFEEHNLVVNVGLQHILDILFVSATTQIDPWYVGLTATTPSPAAADTMASHAGWTEFEDYSEGTRQAYVDVRSAQSVTNAASKAVFSIDSGGTVGGAFLTSDNTKGGSSGTLLSAVAATEGNRVVVSGDTINATYTFGAADDGV